MIEAASRLSEAGPSSLAGRGLGLLAVCGLPSSLWLFDVWLGAGDFQTIILGWPYVAVAGFVGNLAFVWAVSRSLRRPSYAVWTGAIGIAIGLALCWTAAFDFSFDFPAFLNLVIAPVIAPMLPFTAGPGGDSRIALALTGCAYLGAGALQLWAVGRWAA